METEPDLSVHDNQVGKNSSKGSVIFYGKSRKGLCAVVTFEQRHGESELMSHAGN